ncbi:MAG: hypothetical protein ACU84Q_18050 [Gammaproteobacteria bacterium]
MMSPINVLLSFDNLFAIAVFSVIALAEPFLEKWLHDLLEDSPPFCLGWDYFFAPLLRAGAVIFFIFLAYPALFGLNVAPTMQELLTDENAKTGSVLGVLFLLGLLLPLIPTMNRHPEFVLPVQGSFAAAYVFAWLAHYLHITTANVWPGLDVFFLMVLCSYLGHRIAGKAGRLFGGKLDQQFSTHGLALVSQHIVELLVQIPVILIYGYGLGRQLSM